jgi:hypothetical protein
MPTKRHKPPTGRKHGAQPGNKNAEKHGFYSRRFNTDENGRLSTDDRFAVEDELDLLRVCMDRLTAELSFEPVHIKDMQGNTTRDGHYLGQLNTLATMTEKIAGLIRTHYLTRGKGGTLEQGILEALEEVRLELGL